MKCLQLHPCKNLILEKQHLMFSDVSENISSEELKLTIKQRILETSPKK